MRLVGIRARQRGLCSPSLEGRYECRESRTNGVALAWDVTAVLNLLFGEYVGRLNLK